MLASLQCGPDLVSQPMQRPLGCPLRKGPITGKPLTEGVAPQLTWATSSLPCVLQPSTRGARRGRLNLLMGRALLLSTVTLRVDVPNLARVSQMREHVSVAPKSVFERERSLLRPTHNRDGGRHRRRRQGHEEEAWMPQRRPPPPWPRSRCSFCPPLPPRPRLCPQR